MINLENELNKEQFRAVTHRGKPLLVLAGAGSGKTRVLTYRAYWLIKNEGVDPRKIVLLTFTNKAAKEMVGRVRELLMKQGSKTPYTSLQIADQTAESPENCNSLGFAGTFHGFCVRLLRIYGETIGVTSKFVIYDTSDQRKVMKKALVNLSQENSPKKVRMYLAIISKYKNSLVDLETADRLANDGYQKTVVRVWQEYQRLLRKFGALDFDDLLTMCVKLLKNKTVRDNIHKRFDWVLVDEYQDTNKAQFEMTRLLVSNPGQLMVVGDASQAIYSFRGADFRNLKLLKRCFKGLEVAELVENYRSTQNILDAAHAVIGNNTSHPSLELKTNKDKGDKVVVFEGADGRSEARFVLNGCLEAIKKERSAAVLYRTNAQSRVIEEELIRSGVGYRLVGGMKFYERAEIKDVLAYLRAAVNRGDEVAWERVDKLGKRRRASFEKWLDLNLVDKMPTNKLIETILEKTRYLDRFDRRSEEDLGRLENIDELMAMASEFPEVGGFLENAALIQAEDIADRLQPKKTQVTLMTIHSAKGLEFDRVFVIGLEEGLLPHSRSLMEKDSLEEERRLLYVAITRARQKLFLSYANLRFLYGGRSNQSPSRFLGEIPEKLVTKMTPSWGGPQRFYPKEKCAKIRRPPEEEVSKRRIVQDWEVERESRSDFDEIDSW